MWENCVLVAQPFCLARICGSSYFLPTLLPRGKFVRLDLDWIFQFLLHQHQPWPATLLMRQNVTHDTNRDDDDLIDFTCTGVHRKKNNKKKKSRPRYAMLFDYETMGMRSIIVMNCMIWTRNSSRHTSHTLPPIHHHCVINYPGRPTNAISLLLFSSFIVVIGAFCWGWSSVLLRYCHGHCQIEYDLTGTAVSWLPVYSNGTREYSMRSLDQTTNLDSRPGWFNALCCLSFASAVEKRKYGVDSCCIFICRPDLWWLSFFRVGGLVLSFFPAHCSYISGGYLSSSFLNFFFLSFSRSCWCLHAGFVGRRFRHILFHLSFAKRRPSHFYFFPVYARCPCFIVFYVLDIKPGRLSD